MNLAISFKNTDLACYYMMVEPFHDILYEKNMKNLQTNIYLAFFWILNILFHRKVIRFSFVSVQKKHTVRSV